MSVPSAKGRSARARRINFLLKRPSWQATRRSRAVRDHLDVHGYVTPHIKWSEMDDTGGSGIPRHLRSNAIRHAWNLERFSAALGRADKRKPKRGRVPIVIDGPYRTEAHNRAIHGAIHSRHVQADASDHFRTQVQKWSHETGLSEHQIIQIALRYFTAVGNETSGTLHFDSRPGKPGSVQFTTWVGA